MAKRPPNPNTAYGRRRIAEEKFAQNQKWREENPKAAKNKDNGKTIFGVLVLIVIIILAIASRMIGNDHYGAYGGHYKMSSGGNKEYYKKKK